MKKLLLFLWFLALCLPGSVFAQSNYTASELDTLVSNIALYPDPLLVHVLTASTYGEQISPASQWAQNHEGMEGEALAEAMENANLKFDPSVQALIPFPTVLSMMAKYRTWTDQLGDAVSSQKDDVMDAVQRMRNSAYEHGHLLSDDKNEVTETSGNISINPVNIQVVYVPVYNPRVVYYVYADGYTAVSYRTGIWIGTWYGEWGWGSCYFDWGPRIIYVRNTRWYAHRPIPHHPRRYNPPPRPRNEPRVAPTPSLRSQSRVAPASSPRKETRVAPAPSPKIQGNSNWKSSSQASSSQAKSFDARQVSPSARGQASSKQVQPQQNGNNFRIQENKSSQTSSQSSQNGTNRNQGYYGNVSSTSSQGNWGGGVRRNDSRNGSENRTFGNGNGNGNGNGRNSGKGNGNSQDGFGKSMRR